MEFQFLGGIYENENGEKLFDVKVGNDTLKGLKAAKRKNSKCSNCKHYHGCAENRVYRKYDCKRNSSKVKNIFVKLTTLIVALFSIWFFKNFNFGFFYKMSLLVLCLTGFDMVCTFVEWCVPKIYDWSHYRKWQKMLKEQKKKKQAEEAKLRAEEEAKFSNIPCYKDVKNARITAETFADLSKQCDYGTDADSINACVECCNVIMQILEKDPSLYYGVSDVFERHLPRICMTMTLHKKAIEDDTVSKKQKQLFTRFIESALKYLDRKKTDIIYYDNSEEVELQLSADTYRQSSQEENKE